MKKEKKKEKVQRKYVVAVVAILFFVAAGVGTFFAIKRFSGQKREETSTSENEETKEKESGKTADEKKEEEKDEKEESEEKDEEEETESSPYAGTGVNSNGTNSSSTYNAVAHEIDGVKVVYYKTLVWGSVEANFEDFRTKVKETLADSRGWERAGLRFVEVTEGQDLNIVLSDADHLEGYDGYCSGQLSCTSGQNEVIINDERWREGTEATVSGGMTTREYQHMVLNHEVGHWLGHYSHIEACDADGGVAPIMLQQSTGLRNCGSFNPWPLDDELWTLR